MQQTEKPTWNTKAKYKLVVYFINGNGRNRNNAPKVFFSRERLDKKPGGQDGLFALMKYVSEIRGKYNTAIIYDNSNNNTLHKWVLNSDQQIEKRV